MSRGSSAGPVLLLLLSASGLHAAPERATAIASWQGAPGCADRAALEAEVERLLAGSSAPAPLVVHAEVHAMASGYGLLLRTTEAEADRRFQRELTAASCQELLRAGAIVVALAIDPAAANRALGAEHTEVRPPTANFELPASNSPATPEPPAAAAAASAAAPDPPSAAAARPERDQPAALPPERRDGVVLVPFLRAAGVWDSGVLPAPSWGVLFAGGVSGAGWRADLGLTYLPPRRAALEEDPGKGGDVHLIAGTSSGCWWFGRDRFELGLCGGVEAGALVGHGVGVDRPVSGSFPWLAGRAGGFGAYRIERWLSLELNAGALVRVGRAQFVLDPLGSIHEPAPVTARVDFGPRFDLE